MRRCVTEWLVILAGGLFLAAISVFAASLHSAWPAEPIQLAYDRWGNGIVYLQISGGNASLFSELDFDSADSPKPYVANPRAIISPRVVRNHQFAVPGLAAQFCRFAAGPPVWSLRVSLALPAMFSLITAVLLTRRLRRLRPQDAPARVETPQPSEANSAPIECAG
jgi:hypothetical protein